MSLSMTDSAAMQRALEKLQEERNSGDNPLDFYDGWFAAAEYYLEELSAEISLSTNRLEKIEELESELYNSRL